jgi:hypothetical protein
VKLTAGFLMVNPEYLSVLAQVVECVRSALRHENLPDLPPEQVLDWLQTISVEDVKSVWQEKSGSSAAGK